jgi:pimeloyl-ACP methyl ester carboxylesterase
VRVVQAGPNVAAPPACTVTAVGRLGAAARAFAPYADEAVAGMSFGVAAGAPVRSRLDLGVAGGARVLASVVRELLPRASVRVLPAPPFAGGRPAWADAPSGTVAEALARTADLYPWGSGVAGRDVPGAPEGTVGVERVEHADGRVSWTVLVPGTQGVVSPVHPFDGVTDLDLMAKEAAEVTAAVEDALALADASPDEPVVLVGHSLGGIAAVALASSPGFAAKHRLGGVVTAGSPTATFAVPPGVPVLHLENDEELVSPLDGRSGAENPGTRDRVTVGRSLRASPDPADVAASGSVGAAHGMPTHLRTLRLAREAGSAPVTDVVTRLERLLGGERAETRFYVARRVPDVGQPAGPIVLAPGEGPVSRASSGPALR